MANKDVDPHQMYEALKAFHSMEQAQSQAASVVMSEMMNWLLKRIEANSEFLSMFGHIVPQPMMSTPPDDHGPPPVPADTGQVRHDSVPPIHQPALHPDDVLFESRLAELRRRYPLRGGAA